MFTINVDLGPRSYPIHIGDGILERLADLIPDNLRKRKTCIVSDTTVYPVYGTKISNGLSAAGSILTRPFTISPGEPSKSMAILEDCYHHLLREGCDRSSLIVIVGGGIPGDLGGFAAATFMRGIPFAQIPTTLMAQADASVGGKTGINLAEGKNLVGAFHQPDLVISDTRTLKTLPERHLRNGMAEIVKMAVLCGEPLWEIVEHFAARPGRLGHPPGEILRECCRFKAEIITRDEHEKGVRTGLNLGHTIGHAIEASDRYTGILHGEAVAAGLTVASEIAVSLDILKRSTADRILGVLSQLGLKPAIFHLDVDSVLSHVKWDKKTAMEKIRMVLPAGIGKTIIHPDVPLDVLRDKLKSVCESGRKIKNSE
ncbi:3-dehydroquinate synthase [bacterium]|nr:3-dehydroquinate synthase [candidate division CSSED10-310 bacterium]